MLCALLVNVDADKILLAQIKDEKKEIKYIFVQEFIKLGQRVRTFDVEIEKDGGWEKVASSTTIGYKKILPLSPVLTSKVRIKITGARACPCISNVEVY